MMSSNRASHRFASRMLAVVLVALALGGALLAGPVARAAEEPELPFFPQPAFPDWTNWLAVVNYWRTVASVEPVAEEPAWSRGAFEHARYLVRNNATGHEQDASLPDATPEGALAAKNGNVLRGFADPELAIEAWMRAPFHAAWVVNPRLTRVGFGSYADATGTAATLDVIRGIEPKILKKYTVFPGQGTYVKATSFIGENPDPRERCPSAYTTAPSLGLPLFALLAEPPVSPSATLKENGRFVEACTFTGPATLASVNGVYILPRKPLRAGARYDVFVRSGSTTVQWNFWVIGPPGTVRNVAIDSSGDAPLVRWTPPTDRGGLALTNMVVGVTGADGVDRQIPLDSAATEFPLASDDVFSSVRVWAANVAGPGAAVPAEPVESGGSRAGADPAQITTPAIPNAPVGKRATTGTNASRPKIPSATRPATTVHRKTPTTTRRVAPRPTATTTTVAPLVVGAASTTPRPSSPPSPVVPARPPPTTTPPSRPAGPTLPAPRLPSPRRTLTAWTLTSGSTRYDHGAG